MSVEFSQINRSLKAAIKAKGFTYKRLAEEIGMSEAGLKRLLNAEDCSLQRLLKICKVIDVSLDDLIAIKDDVDDEVQSFTAKQVELFNSSLEHLKYYYKLRIERLSPDEIRAQLALSEKKNKSILFDLDRVGLIELQPGDKIADLGRRNVHWRQLAKPLMELKYDFTEDLKRRLKVTGERDGYYPIYHLQMTDLTRKELYRELEALVEKYVMASTREALARKPQEIKPLNVAFLLAPTYGFDSRTLDEKL